jgi:hypothetical protein
MPDEKKGDVTSPLRVKDLERAFKMLNSKKLVYDKLFNYYEGKQPLVYLASRLDEIFKDLNAYFAENWCSVVIDSARDRINLKEIQIQDVTAAKTWAEIWERSELALESDEVHEAAMVAGEGYVVAWPDNEGRIEAYANDPRMCHIFYEPEFPRKKKFAAKWWVDDGERMRMTLYYPDRLEYYISSKKAENVTSYQSLVAMKVDKAENKFKEVPVFHFRLARKLKSDLTNVVPIQNGINKILTDMMVTAEFQAFPQRYVISQADIKGKLKNAPRMIWELPAGDGMSQQTVAGQFAAADLENYLKAIDNLAGAISSITRTPKHYFFSVGSNLSGEALIAMEAPLNKKAKDRIDRFTPAWKQTALFMLRAAGVTIEASKVNAIFDKPETIQPRTQAETRQMNVIAGLPIRTILREEGKSEEEIKQVERDIAEAKTAQANLASAYLAEARKKFDQENPNLNPTLNPTPNPSPSEKHRWRGEMERGNGGDE